MDPVQRHALLLEELGGIYIVPGLGVEVLGGLQGGGNAVDIGPGGLAQGGVPEGLVQEGDQKIVFRPDAGDPFLLGQGAVFILLQAPAGIDALGELLHEPLVGDALVLAAVDADPAVLPPFVGQHHALRAAADGAGPGIVAGGAAPGMGTDLALGHAAQSAGPGRQAGGRLPLMLAGTGGQQPHEHDGGEQGEKLFDLHDPVLRKSINMILS